MKPTKFGARARRSWRCDPSLSLHRTHYGLLDDGRARATPWSSDLKLGSLNLTTLLQNRANAHPPSSQNAVAGVVEARPLPNWPFISSAQAPHECS